MNDDEVLDTADVEAEEEARQAAALARAQRAGALAGWRQALAGADVPGVVDTLEDIEVRDYLVGLTIALSGQWMDKADMPAEYIEAMGEVDMSEEARRNRVAIVGELVSAYDGPARQNLLCVYALMAADVEAGDIEGDYKDALSAVGSFVLPILMASAEISPDHTLTNLLAGLCTSRVGAAS